MTTIRVVRDYAHPPEKVWRALTEPALMARWGMRPEGFSPVVGARFRLFGVAHPLWRGYVEGEVLEVDPPRWLHYTWDDDGRAAITHVTYGLERTSPGTRLTVEHSGFVGASGFVFARALMKPGWRSSLDRRLPSVLAALGGDGPGRVETAETARSS